MPTWSVRRVVCRCGAGWSPESGTTIGLGSTRAMQVGVDTSPPGATAHPPRVLVMACPPDQHLVMRLCRVGDRGRRRHRAKGDPLRRSVFATQDAASEQVVQVRELPALSAPTEVLIRNRIGLFRSVAAWSEASTMFVPTSRHRPQVISPRSTPFQATPRRARSMNRRRKPSHGLHRKTNRRPILPPCSVRLRQGESVEDCARA